jgi:cation transport protein ChaC
MTTLEQTTPMLPPGDLWVFGYGSLRWRPGFDYLEMHTARLHGYHRALCVWSWVHRGTQQYPGLVFGLDSGGSCLGRVFRVAATLKQTVADYLYAREMVTPVYRPRLQQVYYSGTVVRALTFVVDRQHPQYAGKLAAETAAVTVRAAHGHSGCNKDYLMNTVAHLEELGIHDPQLYRSKELVLDAL